jgi:pimeloyl-ACP methyl ester carboxylesterase
MRCATTPDGVKLAYQLHDFTDPWRHAPTIMLQHGFGRHGGFWYKWIPYLSRHYRLLLPDMRGFGRSREGFSIAGGFSLDHFAGDIAHILDHAGIDQVHYVGEALGGTIGLQAASQYADRFRSLSVLSTPVYLHRKVQDIFALDDGSWGDAIRRNGIRKWAESTNTVSRFPPWMNPGFLAWYSEELATTDVETLASLTEICASYDQTRFLAGITAPVLGLYTRSREEQVDILRQHVKSLRIHHIETEFYLFYQMFPRSCAEMVLHFVGMLDDLPVTEP